MSHSLRYLLHLPACSVCHVIPFPLGDPVSCGGSVSVAVCHVITDFPGVLLSLSRDLLAHEIYPSFLIGFHLCWGC